MAVLPMFPLGTVLLPGGILPLHVFEPRYQALTEACLAGDRTFGVVLIERGSEVGGGDVRTDVGTTARIVSAQPAGEGRWYLVAVGTRRLRVSDWRGEEPYPTAEVDEWDDPPDAALPTPDAYRDLLAETRRVLALAAEVGLPVPDATQEFADDPRLGTFQIAASLPFGPLDRQRVLRTDGAEARTQLVMELLGDARVLLEARLGAPEDPDPPSAPGDLP